MGSGAKLMSVCYFEEQNDWWVSKHIKKQIRSTVTCLDWHPNNVLLACGSTDFKTRIFSAYLKEVDKKSDPASLSTPWGGKNECGSTVAEFNSSQGSGGWVHSVAFSPDGNRLAWVAHDSSISVVDANKNMHLINVRTKYLPFLSCVWPSNKLIVAAVSTLSFQSFFNRFRVISNLVFLFSSQGHDCCPMLYFYDDSCSELRFIDKVDKSLKKESDGMR